MILNSRPAKYTAGLLVVVLSFFGTGQTVHADDVATVDDSTSTVSEVTVNAVVSQLSDSGALYTYNLPDGSVMTVPYPPADFNPLTASDRELATYDIDPRPSKAIDLQEWNTVHANYVRPNAPNAAIELKTSNSAASTAYQPQWGGWLVGSYGSTSPTYVAVKGNFVIPQITTSCNYASASSAWIGLGGYSGRTNDLVQQGVTRCDFFNSSGLLKGWIPFSEFANTEMPMPLCGSYAPIPVGHTIYQNMSFQRSSNTAYFYLDDQSVAGGTLSCHLTGPSGWVFNGGTAEWIMEKMSSYLDDYNVISWSNVQAETASDSSFHYISSQPYVKIQTGQPGILCQTTSNTSSNTNFTTSWVAATC
ncbi:MAG: hypothetical protein RL196_196 [Actinomycetota bacterium]